MLYIIVEIIFMSLALQVKKRHNTCSMCLETRIQMTKCDICSWLKKKEMKSLLVSNIMAIHIGALHQTKINIFSVTYIY